MLSTFGDTIPTLPHTNVVTVLLRPRLPGRGQRGVLPVRRQHLVLDRRAQRLPRQHRLAAPVQLVE